MSLNVPELSKAIHIEELTKELRRGCPFRMPMRLADDRMYWVNAWEVPINLPIPGSGRFRDPPIDLQPLETLYDLHWKERRSPGRWVHEYYYFEILDIEKRLTPDFWVRSDAWGQILRVRQLLLNGAPTRGVLPQPDAWPSYWAGRIYQGAIKFESPETWLSMLEWDARAAETYMTFDEGLRWRMIPIYMEGVAEDVKLCMQEDLAKMVLSVPGDSAELMERWKSWAGRLGIPHRWKTSKEQDLARREQLVLDLLMDGECPSDIAHTLMKEGLYPVHPKGHDPSYDEHDTLRNATTTVYRLTNELKERGVITEAQINRRPRGRPPKND